MRRATSPVPIKLPGSAADLRSGEKKGRIPMVMGALPQMLSEVAWGKLHRHAARHGHAQLTMAQQVPLAPTKASTFSIQEDRYIART
jgi:hypothetical protein